jgi:hypothetical protein
VSADETGLSKEERSRAVRSRDFGALTLPETLGSALSPSLSFNPGTQRTRRSLRSDGSDISRQATLDAPEHDQNDDNKQHQTKTAATIIAGAVERPAAKSTKAAKQCKNQNDDENGA